MKKKIMGGVLLTGILGALIAGGTMAWFTDDAVLAEAEFTAGTVVVNTEGPTAVAMAGKFVDNVNPGDCATVIWDIINDGTKAAELRVKLDDMWLKDGLDLDNVSYTPAQGSGWVTVMEDGDEWFYYTGGSVPGTYKDQVPTIIQLPIVIGFDGELTDNTYQGEAYEILGTVEAIQASNGAPLAVWGDSWTDAKENNVNQINAYFTEGPGQNMTCWTTSFTGNDQPVVDQDDNDNDNDEDEDDDEDDNDNDEDDDNDENVG